MRRNEAYRWHSLMQAALLSLGMGCLLTACSDSDAPGDQKEERVQLEMRPYVPSFLEIYSTQTRSIPTGYVSYDNLIYPFTPQQSLVDAKIHTFFTKSDGTMENGVFVKSGGSWYSTVKLGQNQYLYGYVPENAALNGVADIQPVSGDYKNGIIFKLKKLSSVTPADVCVTVAAGRGSDSGPDESFAKGKFDLALKEGNYVYLLFDHLYSSICFSFKVDADYNKLRTIKLTKLNLTSTEMKKYVDATITLTANNTGADPVTNLTFNASGYTETADGLLFEADATNDVDPVELTTTESDFLGCFVPGNYNRFTLKSTYDVYDKKGNRIRKDCVAENSIYLNSIVPSNTWKRGTMLKLNLTVNPTYLYMLSEPDLDNPTVTLM